MRVFILGAGSSVYAGFPLGRNLWAFLLDHCGFDHEPMEPISNYLSTLSARARAAALADFEGLLTRFQREEIPLLPALEAEARRPAGWDANYRRWLKANMRHWRQNFHDWDFRSFWRAQTWRRKEYVSVWRPGGGLSSLTMLTNSMVNAFLVHHACIRFGRRHFAALGRAPPTSGQHFDRACPCRQERRIGGIKGRLAQIGRAFRRGDTIISFNYDGTIEAALWEARKWHFIDGYGIPIEIGCPETSRMLRAKRFRSPSPITLLKPHGSINWIRSSFDDAVGLDHLDLLFGLASERTFVAKIDQEGYEEEHILSTLIAPTYDKQYETIAALSAVWDRARSALRTATEITVLGYSLPAGDRVAEDYIAEALRANKDCASVEIVSPADPHRGNWGAVLDRVDKDLVWKRQSFENWLDTCAPVFAD